MLYLFGQVWILLLIAFILGWVAHWLLCCRGKQEEKTLFEAADEEAPAVNNDSPPQVQIDEAWKPSGFSMRPDQVNDLKRIKGVGKVIEQTLNELGIYQFQQIADWDEQNVSWVENFLSFPGRIQREDWINQARTLNEGGTTEFAKRVDKGELDY